jgi:SHS2 domain-containing protein
MGNAAGCLIKEDVVDPIAGFRELEHTADWELEVWAPNLPSLLEQAARGMYTLAGARLSDGSRHVRQLDLPIKDPESLLVTFLAELLFLGEQEGLAFDTFDLEIEQDRLHASLAGAQLVSIDKEIKAVTYHNLAVRKTPTGLAATLVFDV